MQVGTRKVFLVYENRKLRVERAMKWIGNIPEHSVNIPEKKLRIDGLHYGRNFISGKQGYYYSYETVRFLR